MFFLVKHDLAVCNYVQCDNKCDVLNIENINYLTVYIDMKLMLSIN